MSRSHFLVCLFLLTAPLSGQTDSAIPSVPPGTNLKDPNALLPLAIAANSLDRPGVPPYYLKATYETFDEQGKQQDSGTFEEWRLAPETWKRTYTGAHFSQTEYKNSAGVYYETDAGPAPWPISLVAKELVHPAPEEWETKDAKPDLQQINVKPAKLSCLMLAPFGKKMQLTLGLLPTYCFNVDSVMLRIEIFNGTMQALRNEIVAFHGVYLAKEISVSDGIKPLLHIHLSSVVSLSAAEIAATSAQPGFAKASSSDTAAKLVSIDAGVMAGQKIGGPNPTYPPQARLSRVQGTVMLSVVIGTDGHIHDLKVVSSPDNLLTMSAVAAVGGWVYKPYTLGGRPVSVQTTVHIVYRLGY